MARPLGWSAGKICDSFTEPWNSSEREGGREHFAPQPEQPLGVERRVTEKEGRKVPGEQVRSTQDSAKKCVCQYSQPLSPGPAEPRDKVRCGGRGTSKIIRAGPLPALGRQIRSWISVGRRPCSHCQWKSCFLDRTYYVINQPDPGSCYVVPAGLELLIFLPRPPECCLYRHVPPRPDSLTSF